MTLATAAKLARVTPKYLRECERTGQFSHIMATKLARHYGARLEDFLPTRQPRTAQTSRQVPRGYGVDRKLPRTHPHNTLSANRTQRLERTEGY